ncbi:hypothetical protein PSPO01_00681 [Paraphaeosphaeria sporulosa]
MSLAFKDSVVKSCPRAATCPPPAANFAAQASKAIGCSLGPHPLPLPPHIVTRAKPDAKWIWTISQVAVESQQYVPQNDMGKVPPKHQSKTKDSPNDAIDGVNASYRLLRQGCRRV